MSDFVDATAPEIRRDDEAQMTNGRQTDDERDTLKARCPRCGRLLSMVFHLSLRDGMRFR